jgi:hypothetical protein
MKRFALILLLAAACSNKAKPAPTKPEPPGPTPTASVAKEGETCGDGMMGTPNMPCAEGLVCDTSAAQDPPADAASSGKVGTCKKPPE